MPARRTASIWKATRKAGTTIQAAGATGPHDHTYLSFGTFYMYGDSLQLVPGTPMGSMNTFLTNREPYYRVGGDFSYNYRTFNVYGLYMLGHDDNYLPVDSPGRCFLFPSVRAVPRPLGFCEASPRPSAEALCRPTICLNHGSWRLCAGIR